METNVDSGSSVNASDDVLAKELDKVVAVQPSQSKTGRLSGSIQNLFTPQCRLIMSTLRDIQEEQQRLGNALTSLRVPLINCCLLAVHTVVWQFVLVSGAERQ